MNLANKPCIHCKSIIESDAWVCPVCGSNNPFRYLCPFCMRPVSKTDEACACCSRPLVIACPACGGRTFAGERCEGCGASFMVKCKNKNCGQRQFYQIKKCAVCGKRISLR